MSISKIAGSPAMAQSLSCPAGKAVSSKWDADLSYDLRVDTIQGAAGELKQIQYIGDIVDISDRNMRSIIRSPDGPAENVDTLIFEGRRIDVAGSVSLKGASVQFTAMELHFMEGAYISLFGDRKSTKAELVLTVQNLYLLDDEFSKPIDIYYTAAGDGPKISIRAMAVWRGGTAITDPDEARLSVWRMIGASDDMDTPPADGSVEILVGSAADQAYELASASIKWPGEVYAKALRLQAAYPFECDVQKDILRWQAQVQPLLEKTSLAQASAGFPLLAARVTANLDAYGHGPSWAPRKALGTQIKSFQDDLNQLGTPRGLLSDELIGMISHGFDNTAPDPSNVQGLQEKKQELAISIEDLDTQIQKNLDATWSLKDEFSQLKLSIEAAKTRIARSSLDEQKRLHDAATAKQGLATVGAVVGVATSFFGTPAAGAAVAAGFNAVGDAVYKHNVGGSLDAKSIEDIIKDAQAFYSGMDSVMGNWNSLKDNKSKFDSVRKGDTVTGGDGKTLTESQAASNFGKSVLTFGKSFLDLTQGLNVPVPQPLSLTQKENLDPALQEYLELLSDNQGKQATVTNALLGLVANRTTEKAELDQTTEALRNLLDVHPANDEAYIRWTDWARYLWTADIRWIVKQIYILQRSFGFEIGRDIPLQAEISAFPASLSASVDASTFDVLAPGTKVTGAEVTAYLTEQRARIRTSANAVYQACQAGVEDYLSTNQKRVAFQRGVEFRIDDRDANRRTFVEAINAQIQLLIARKRAGYDVERLEPIPDKATPGSPASHWNLDRRPRLIPLYVPFLFEPPLTDIEPPQRFIRARVDSIQWTNPSAHLGYDGINFTIIHPGYGEIGSVGNRRFIDLRENNAVNEIKNVTTTLSLKEKDAPITQIDADIGAAYYTYFPARSNYFLTVDVTTVGWAKLPQIAEIVLVWELFQ